MNLLEGPRIAFSMFSALNPRLLRLGQSVTCSGPARWLLPRLRNVMLRRSLRHAFAHSPHYARVLTQAAPAWRSIRTLDQLPLLGFFTRPSDLMADPGSFLAVPFAQVGFCAASTGSTGAPKTAFFTRREWSLAIQAAAWGLRVSGVGPGDVVNIMFCFGKPAWMTGHFCMEAAQQAGAMVVPVGNMDSTATQLERLRTFRTTVLMGTPSALWKLTAEARGMGVDTRAFGIRQIRCGAEALLPQVRALLKGAWGAEVYDGYGSAETASLVGSECSAHDGFHHSPTLAVEVVNPLTGEPVPQGETGELVFTTLTLARQAMPLIRYRTGDLGFLKPDEPCVCGEFPTARIGAVTGRVDGMVTLGSGENFFPERFQQALMAVSGVHGFQVVVEKDGFRDRLRVRVEAQSPHGPSALQVGDALLKAIPELRTEMEGSGTMAPMTVEFLAPGALTRESPTKIHPLVDRRAPC